MPPSTEIQGGILWCERWDSNPIKILLKLLRCNGFSFSVPVFVTVLGFEEALEYLALVVEVFLGNLCVDLPHGGDI